MQLIGWRKWHKYISDTPFTLIEITIIHHNSDILTLVENGREDRLFHLKSNPF